MTSKDIKTIGILGAGLLILGPMIAKQAAYNAAMTVTDIATGAATGAVVSVGKTIGIPETNMTQCQKDLMAGKKWDASFSCPASDFLKYMYDGTIPNMQGLDGIGGTVPDWKTLALVGGVLYLVMKKKGR